jgi:hypothetical protein
MEHPVQKERIFIILRLEFVSMAEGGSKLRQLFTYERKASRIELFVRIVYWILIGIVITVYGILAGICLIIQWFVILILGRRNQGLGEFIQGYVEYYVHVMNYVYFFTDTRPRILPEPVKIFKEVAGMQEVAPAPAEEKK